LAVCPSAIRLIPFNAPQLALATSIVAGSTELIANSAPRRAGLPVAGVRLPPVSRIAAVVARAFPVGVTATTVAVVDVVVAAAAAPTFAAVDAAAGRTRVRRGW
jgi:hypothetical protein